jgi:pentose-5-phosphate-3-epimerase
MNDIKNAPNKIIVQCESIEHGEEIIQRIKDAKFGDVLHL